MVFADLFDLAIVISSGSSHHWILVILVIIIIGLSSYCYLLLTGTRAVSRILMQLPFLANGVFWASSDNLGLKHPAKLCMQVAFGAPVQGKSKPFGALKVVKGP